MTTTTRPETEAAIRAWLLDYAWNGSDDAQAREVDCIMAQDGWRYVDITADQFSGAQEEPGPAAYDEGLEFALSALYECHDAPHQETCPGWRPPAAPAAGMLIATATYAAFITEGGHARQFAIVSGEAAAEMLAQSDAPDRLSFTQL